MDFIYKMSWFDSLRHNLPNTIQYYKNVQDTYWGFENDCYNGILRVELIKVPIDSQEYQSAIFNSKFKK